MKIIQNSNIPIYKQISEQLKGDILAGKIKEGEYLPSIRGLAQELRISVITTMKAYEELASEGLVTPVQGKGFYVNAQDSELLKEQHMRRIEDALTEAISAAKIAGISEKELVSTLKTLIELSHESE
jgi:GntR family transcriptional regulator